MSFVVCLPIILASEGGFVVDQGGPTNLGVTIPALQAWLRRPCNAEDIRTLTPAAVAPLYEADYYNASGCNQLAAGLDLMVFDEAVNEGIGRAVRHLQESLGIVADGDFGPKTAAAAYIANVAKTINTLHDTNAEYYATLDRVYPQDEKGWTERNDRTRALALKMVA